MPDACEHVADAGAGLDAGARAGRTRTTRLAPNWPMTRCGIVSPRIGPCADRFSVFVGVLGGLLDGGRHLVGLAVAQATRPRLSPTTTRALKLNRRPPLTTAAQRRIFTTRLRARPARLLAFSRHLPILRSRGAHGLPTAFSASPRSRVQNCNAALAGGVGQGLDPAMIAVVSAVEAALLMPVALAASASFLPDGRGRLDVAAVRHRRLRASTRARPRPASRRSGRRSAGRRCAWSCGRRVSRGRSAVPTILLADAGGACVSAP